MFSQRGEGWVDMPLGNVCSFLNGFAFKSKDTVDDSNTQLIRMGNLYQNVLDLERKPSFYPGSFSEKYVKYKLSEGDLIISLTGTVGKEDYGFTVEIPKVDRVLLLNQRIAKFININAQLIEKDFLFRTVRSKFFLEKLYSTANGTRQANLSTQTMRDILIKVPSLEVQRKVCLSLDLLELETQKLEKIYSDKLIRLA